MKDEAQIISGAMQPRYGSGGSGGCSGGVFGESYASLGRVANVIPVDVIAPGCPPGPNRILAAILTAISTPPAR
jgi:Ni,Fe-hydrogenase III small subunit